MRVRWRSLVGLATLLAACAGSDVPETAGQAAAPEVRMVDDEFDPPVIRVPVGGTVVWTHAGTNPHNVFASDGSWQSAEVMTGGERYSYTFDQAGAVPYFCTFHGTAEGAGMAGWVLVGDTAEVPAGAEVEPVVAQPTGDVREVPSQYPTVQAAVDAARPGDLVLIAPGVYREAVRVTTPSLTIRGLDRNTTILDGGFQDNHGVWVVEADGVAIENLTARNFAVNGFYWTGVTGYRGSHLTAYNNGDYGIYAFNSIDGLFEHSYASGNVDSGFYVGQCFPCEAVLREVIAEGNGLAYSGTNAGGHLYLISSIWRDNMGGIVPNSLDSELEPPHRETTIVGNMVIDNSNADAPSKGFARLAYGNGIVLAGGVGDVVERNLVLNHLRAGIVATTMIDESIYFSQRARVAGNTVAGSGWGDLILVGPWGPGNCFDDNAYETSQPPLLGQFHRCSGLRLPLQASGGPLMLLAGVFADSNAEFPAGGDFRTYPAPPPQPNMSDAAGAPARPAVDVFQVPDLARIQVPDPPPEMEVRAQEVLVSGIPISEPTVWQLIFATYGYLLPIVLLAAWAAIALWDLARREAGKGFTIVWMAVILLVPFVGAVAYHLFGRPQVPAWFRGVLIGGGAVAYLAILVVTALVGGLV